MELISKPVKVRGLGNVVDLRGSEEYICNHSVTSDSTATIEGKSYGVIVMGNAGEPVYFTYSIGELRQGVTTNVTFNLKRVSNNANISGASIGYYVNGELSTTGTTNSSGNVTFTMPTGFGSFELKLKYNGSSTYAKKIETINVIVKRRVNYTCVQGTTALGGLDFTVTCKGTNNEPIDNVRVTITNWQGFNGNTNDDGIYHTQCLDIGRPSSFTFELSKEDHYFVGA